MIDQPLASASSGALPIQQMNNGAVIDGQQQRARTNYQKMSPQNQQPDFIVREHTHKHILAYVDQAQVSPHVDALL